MNVPMLDLVAQYATIKDEVLAAMMKVVEAQLFIMGPQVPQLEVEIARLSHAKHGIGCASGTDALLLPLKALNLKPGDEVITTPFTFFATAGTIHNAGGTPVFVDILPDTFNIDPAAVKRAITPRTRAIVPVHLYGQMVDMLELMALAKARGVKIIEDAAQAIGARRKMDGEWRMAGELGWVTGYSFFPSKNLGAWGDGGMIVTSDDAAADRLKKLRLHGGAKQYHHEEVGTNSRLDTLQAAVLLAKLPHLAQWSAKRREHEESMKLTDIAAPDYFHKVVDCQWACPAHTPVPEYIRLISAGRYGDAYMVNWKSNVFPGILGRTCDRPCEPACRRGRVEKEPVAICRLKRVAADYKEDITERLPKAVAKANRNGKRIALVGAGPASLTVARDLAPMGYECVVFDGDFRSGGMMRSQIPKFRLPDKVIDEAEANVS